MPETERTTMPELIDVMPGSPEWLAARRQGVTATDIVTILGLSAWDSVYSLFWRKLGQVPEVPDTDRFRLGCHLEPYIVERWRLEHVYGLNNIQPGILVRSSERAWQMATIDRWLVQDDCGLPLEVKSWADADKRSWGQGEVVDDDGPLVYDDQVPPAVRAQVLWQMDVMGVATGHVGVVFLPSGEFRSYTIEHSDCDAHGTGNSVDCRACADQYLMTEAGEAFMGRLRLELPPPDPDASMATLAAVRARFTRQPDKQADVDGTLHAAWSDAKDLVAHYEAKVRGYESELREQAGEAQVLCVDGQPVARRIVSDAKVKAHTRHMDYLRRITPKGDNDE